MCRICWSVLITFRRPAATFLIRMIARFNLGPAELHCPRHGLLAWGFLLRNLTQACLIRCVWCLRQLNPGSFHWQLCPSTRLCATLEIFFHNSFVYLGEFIWCDVFCNYWKLYKWNLCKHTSLMKTSWESYITWPITELRFHNQKASRDHRFSKRNEEKTRMAQNLHDQRVATLMNMWMKFALRRFRLTIQRSVPKGYDTNTNTTVNNLRGSQNKQNTRRENI